MGIGSPRKKEHEFLRWGKGDPSSSDRVYSAVEAEALRAAEAYKVEHHVAFLTICDMIKVLEGLGYRRPPQAPGPGPPPDHA